MNVLLLLGQGIRVVAIYELRGCPECHTTVRRESGRGTGLGRKRIFCSAKCSQRARNKRRDAKMRRALALLKLTEGHFTAVARPGTLPPVEWDY